MRFQSFNGRKTIRSGSRKRAWGQRVKRSIVDGVIRFVEVGPAKVFLYRAGDAKGYQPEPHEIMLQAMHLKGR
jgi:hypothetical protein